MENKYEVKIYPKAQNDMEGIFKYISNILMDKEAALKLIDKFIESINNISIFPKSAPIIDNEYVKEKLIRKQIVENYIIFYKVDDLKKEIHLIRVLYGMMNYISIL